MKTTTLKKSEVKKEWYILDATDISVGRLASRVSLILKGKNKPQFSPNLPVGDGVIILNTDKVKFSGNKNTDKKYYKHTGHPGGIKEITPEKLKAKYKCAHARYHVEVGELKCIVRNSSRHARET